MLNHEQQSQTTTSGLITKSKIEEMMKKLRPYLLYGTKENLDKVRDILPYYVEPIELPECFFNEDMMDKLILIERHEIGIWKP